MAIQQDAGDESEEHEHDDAQLTLLNEQINGTGGLLEGANPQTGPVIRQSGEFAISDKTLSAVRQLYFHPVVSGIPTTAKMLGTSNYKVVDKTSEFGSVVSDVVLLAISAIISAMGTSIVFIIHTLSLPQCKSIHCCDANCQLRDTESQTSEIRPRPVLVNNSEL